MMQKSRLQIGANVACVIVGILFILFFIYMGSFENNTVYKARDMGTCTEVKDILIREIADTTAPIGFKKEYCWTIEDVGVQASCLSFYLVHQYAEVYFDNELMYRLVPRESNVIGKSVSSNWVVVPIYAKDSGRKVRVVITPVYESSAEREVVFKVGSYFTVFMAQLKHDFLQLFLGLFCIVLGLIQLLFFLCLKEKNTEIMYLSLFSILIGIWKVADTRVSPILFPSNTMVLGYLAIGMLFLINLPVLLFARSRIAGTKAVGILNITTLSICISVVAVLFCQLTGIAEFREMIIVCHIMLLIGMLVITTSMVISHKQIKSSNHTKTFIYFAVLLGCGGIIDIITFQIKGSSSTVFATMVTFITYSIIAFIRSVRESKQKAYTDAQTGLFNKRRCNEIINDKYTLTEPIGIMMLDLNSLKYINDTFGHEAGDKMILDFANMLRNTIPQNNIICRWGGDEFAIIVTNATHEKMEKYMSAIKGAVEGYNTNNSKESIYYAAGYALASDFKGLTYKELFEKADEQMYARKKEWYDARCNTNRNVQ